MSTTSGSDSSLVKVNGIPENHRILRRDAGDTVRILSLVTLPTLGAGNRLRIEQYVPFLRSQGIELEVSHFFDSAAYSNLYERGHTLRKSMSVLKGVARRVRDLLRAREFDLVLVYRESAPVGPPVLERLLSLLSVPYAFDFDDAIFLGPIHPANRRWGWLRQPSRVVEAARGAVAITVGNEYLAAWARRHNEHVAVIPTAVDTERHRPFTRRDGPPVLGWIGSSTTAPYLSLLDEPLRQIATRRPDVSLRVIGGSYRHPSLPTEVSPYRLDREPQDVASFDIGLLPEPDDEWTRGKGAFKALLYMAAGLPVVASRVGVNPDVVVHGETGYCVEDADGWVEALERLIDNPELCRRMGLSGRTRVERLYSTAVQGPRLAAALRDAVARAR